MQQLEGPSKSLFIISSIFLGVPLICVLLRCFTRAEIIKSFGWDDWAMVIATIFHSWFTVCNMIGCLYGLGRNEADFTNLANIETAIMWWWLGQTGYLWGAAFARTSLVLSLVRLTIHRRRRFLLYAVVSFSWTISIVLWLILILACRPTSQFWEQTNLNACLQPSQIITAAYVHSTVAAICDLTLGVFPIPLIWNLQMSRRSKTLLGLTLCIGLLAGFAQLVRIPFIHFSYQNFLCQFALSLLRHTASLDHLLINNSLIAIIWKATICLVVELGLGLIAISLITLRPLLRWVDSQTLRCA